MLYATTLLEWMSTSTVSIGKARLTLGEPHMIPLLEGLFEKSTLDLQAQEAPSL